MVKFLENWHYDFGTLFSAQQPVVLFLFCFLLAAPLHISYINQYTLYLPDGKLSAKKLVFPFVEECPIQDQFP